MATYEINFPQLQSAKNSLEEIIRKLQEQMKRMEDIKTTMLNDRLWQGPNKMRYTQSFSQYQEALAVLYNSAVDQLTKLNEIMQTYAKAETN